MNAPIQNFPRLPRALAAASLAMLVGLSAAGCSWLRTENVEFIVPEYDTAAEQLAFAEFRHARVTPSTKADRREQQMREIIALYEAVPARFPDDREHTPLALLKLGMLHNRMPNRDAKQRAFDLLEQCVRDYAEQDHILARSLYEQGLILDQQLQYERAQFKYREVFDRFGGSSDPDLNELSRKARQRYNQVRTRTEAGIGI